jgi:hypothetical protein
MLMPAEHARTGSSDLLLIGRSLAKLVDHLTSYAHVILVPKTVLQLLQALSKSLDILGGEKAAKQLASVAQFLERYSQLVPFSRCLSIEALAALAHRS